VVINHKGDIMAVRIIPGGFEGKPRAAVPGRAGEPAVPPFQHGVANGGEPAGLASPATLTTVPFPTI